VINNNIVKYQGKCRKEFELIPDISYYNHNYYYGIDGDVLYAESDDYDTTDWYLCNPNNLKDRKPFGWSNTSQHDKIQVNCAI